MLYNGVSNRSRGWRPKNPADLWPMDSRLVRQPSVKKFDGAARSSTVWDSKDPELWLRNGNCFVYLYDKGHSQQGPSFRIHFSSLLSAQCQPLIERFVDRTVSEEEAYQNGKVDLYIPAPTAASRSQAADYHLTIRNLFAWVVRRSVVGRHLGSALIGLVNAMHEFREPGANNFNDLFAYLDEEGYLDMRNQPDHALAILHLAEAFHMRDLYVDAFAHCVGMSEHLYKHLEYSRTSGASRKLIRRARVDMDFRLSRAGSMLTDLLQDELSEAHVGLTTGARAHLNRFRSYIHGFYAAKFGRFPPPAADPKCSTILQPDVYVKMKADFEALYGYLVDETFTTSDNAPSVAHGGLCTLQSVHEFDLRHSFTPLNHPLPFLPEPVKAKESSRRRPMMWFGGGREGKLRPDQRLLTHAALMRATNHTNIRLLNNDLVLAYREFEQDSVMIQHKGEHCEKLGVTPSDARKVRWLFIYAMYQTLRSCTEVPFEVTETSNVSYHLGVSTTDLPPWQSQDTRRPVTSYNSRPPSTSRPRTAERSRSIGAVPLLSPIAPASPEARGGFQIKPDIDYFALTHQGESSSQPLRGRRASVFSSNGGGSLRARSQSLTRNNPFRHSLSLFRAASQRCSSMSSASPSRKSVYHEIIVYGYGNGTNMVSEDPAPTPNAPAPAAEPEQLVIFPTASRSASTSSASSYSSAFSSSPSAAHSMASTTLSTLVDPQSPTSSRKPSESWTSTHTLASKPSYDNLIIPAVVQRKKSTASRKSVKDMYSHDDMLAAAARNEPPPLPRRSSKRFVRRTMGSGGSVVPSKRWSMVDVSAQMRGAVTDSSEDDEAGMRVSPLRLGIQPLESEHDDADDADDEIRDDDLDDWEKSTQTLDIGKEHVGPPCAWEQFNDLGGLQHIHLLKRMNPGLGV